MSIFDQIRQLLGSIGGAKAAPSAAPTETADQRIERDMVSKGWTKQADGNWHKGNSVIRNTNASPAPVQSPQPQITPQAMQTSAPQAQPMTGDLAEIERKIRKGYDEYSRIYHGGRPVPATNYIPVMMDAIKQHDFFRQNPYLIPEQAILETSGGQYITRPNNLINYGVNNPQINNLFKGLSVEEALRRSLTEMGQTGSTYSRFRTGKPLNDQELQDYAKTYEPANGDYYNNLSKGVQFFANQ